MENASVREPTCPRCWMSFLTTKLGSRGVQFFVVVRAYLTHKGKYDLACTIDF